MTSLIQARLRKERVFIGRVSNNPWNKGMCLCSYSSYVPREKRIFLKGVVPEDICFIVEVMSRGHTSVLFH